MVVRLYYHMAIWLVVDHSRKALLMDSVCRATCSVWSYETLLYGGRIHVRKRDLDWTNQFLRVKRNCRRLLRDSFGDLFSSRMIYPSAAILFNVPVLSRRCESTEEAAVTQTEWSPLHLSLPFNAAFLWASDECRLRRRQSAAAHGGSAFLWRREIKWLAFASKFFKLKAVSAMHPGTHGVTHPRHPGAHTQI